MNKLFNLIILILLMIPTVSHADTYMDSFFNPNAVSVVTGLYTKHLSGQTFKDDLSNTEKDYNESNDYFAVKMYMENDLQVSVARFNNSYYDESYALGIHKDLYKPNNYISFGAELLLSSGYEDRLSWGWKVTPVPSAFARVDINHFSAKLSFIGGTVVAITGEYRFYTMR